MEPEKPDGSVPPELPVDRAPEDLPNNRQWITILHLSGLAGLVLPGFGHLLGPLIVWLVKKNDVPGMDAAGRNVMNFQISWTLLGVLSAVVAVAGACLIFPIALPIALFVMWVYLVFKGAVHASNGLPMAFPLTIRFLS